MDSWGQAVIGLWLGLGSSEEPNFFPMLTYFQNKIQPGMDVIDERKLYCAVLYCTISSAWRLRGTVDY